MTSKNKQPGYPSQPQIEENTSIVRFGNLLFHYTGKEEFKNLAKIAMKYVSIPDVANQYFSPGILIADQELSGDPLHLTIVGPKQNRQAQNLFAAAVAYPSAYRRIEWKDPKEGALPNPDVDYPVFKQPAAFICGNKSCSAPIFDARQIQDRIQELTE